MEESTPLYTEIMCRSRIQRKNEDGAISEINYLSAQNGYSNYADSCYPNPHYSSLIIMRGLLEVLKKTFDLF